MSFATEINKATARDNVDTVLLEKVRWSLRQRLRKQMHTLCSDFFDEADDFLFSSGQKGQFSDDSIYLNAMRELRTRQAHFEEQFLDGVIKHIKRSYQSGGRMAANADYLTDSLPGIESIEIDLALKAIRRKAEKHYLAILRQVEESQRTMRATMQAELIGPLVLLDATCSAFAASHPLLQLPLEVRLVVIKLFEQHFIMRMERLFLDIISIVNNVNDPGFVDRLYSSSSAFRTRAGKESKTVMQAAPAPMSVPQPAVKPGTVEAAVGQLIAAMCDHKRLPEFVTTMLQQRWRNVMFLIGMNRGCTSIEWSEARHTANLLVTAVDGQIELPEADREALTAQLRQGFSLVQMAAAEQQEFFSALADYLQQKPEQAAAVRVSAGIGVNRKPQDSGLEASVSPSGESILDQEDLDEIAKMLGDDSTPDSQRELSDYLADVDALGNREIVDFMLNGAYVQCILNKSDADGSMFTISKQGSKVSVTRSRLGLALALQSGELRLSAQAPAQESSSMRTIMEPSSKTRH